MPPARVVALPSVEGTRKVPVVGTPSDEELVRRLATGDSWAKEALYRKHFGFVWSTALRLLGNRVEAEDVVQDAFLTAFDEFDALRDPNALGAWLLRITVHQVHRRYRRRKLLRVLGLEGRNAVVGLELLARDGCDPEVTLELARLDKLLQDLPSAQRIAWMLRRVDGHSLEEVAVACDCSLATAKRRIKAADDQIRQDMEFEGGDDV
jgi:RNA polymerase sigma-70 factor (ECF subfamily)